LENLGSYKIVILSGAKNLVFKYLDPSLTLRVTEKTGFAMACRDGIRLMAGCASLSRPTPKDKIGLIVSLNKLVIDNFFLNRQETQIR
jgi:hypothetical protein